jgi:hypothetical protein
VSPQGTYFCSLSTWLYHFLFVSRLRSYTFKIPRREDKTLIIQLVTDFFLYHFQNTSTCVYMTFKMHLQRNNQPTNCGAAAGAAAAAAAVAAAVVVARQSKVGDSLATVRRRRQRGGSSAAAAAVAARKRMSAAGRKRTLAAAWRRQGGGSSATA